MNNLELMDWIKLWMPELNSVQVGKLRDKFAELERQAYEAGYTKGSLEGLSAS